MVFFFRLELSNPHWWRKLSISSLLSSLKCPCRACADRWQFFFSQCIFIFSLRKFDYPVGVAYIWLLYCHVKLNLDECKFIQLCFYFKGMHWLVSTFFKIKQMVICNEHYLVSAEPSRRCILGLMFTSRLLDMPLCVNLKLLQSSEVNSVLILFSI